MYPVPPPVQQPNNNPANTVVPLIAVSLAVLAAFAVAMSQYRDSLPKQHPQVNQSPTAPVTTPSQPATNPPVDDTFTTTLKSYGLDPSVEYPYWPLVYSQVEYSGGQYQGVVTNYGSRTVSSVRVGARFYDSSHAIVHEGMDYVSSIGPGERWHFKVYDFGLATKAYSAAMTGIRGNGITGDPRY